MNRIATLAALAAASLVAAPSASRAALLTYDLRIAASGSSAGVTVVNSKTATVTGAGQTIALEVYGVLQTADAIANDGISLATGSIVSGTGGLLGTVGNSAVASAFTGLGNGGGTQADLDGDTDLDVGSLSTTAADVTGFAKYRTNNGSSPVAGQTLLLGTATFTTTGSTGATTLNFTPAVLTAGVTAQRNVHAFTIDGVAFLSNGTGTTNVGSGQAISITGAGAVSPEPATLAALAAALGGAAVRRRRAV